MIAIRSQTVKVIKKNDEHFAVCQQLTTIAKQLYNVGLYYQRQNLINDGVFVNHKDVYQIMKANPNWQMLPAKVSNKVWQQVTGSWKHWFKALDSFKNNPNKFTGKPKIPNYISDTNVVTYEKGALNTRGIPEGFIRLSKTDILLNVSNINGNIVEAKIVPKGSRFIIKVIYKKEVEDLCLNKNKVASIDLGVNNLMTITTNQGTVVPHLVNGRPLKSINQYYNKKKAMLQSKLPKGRYNSKAIERLTIKRNNKIDDYLHKASKQLIDWLIINDIGTLIIGKNDQWKSKVNIGKRNNQNFVNIPHSRLVEYIGYKYGSMGGIVKLTEESYSSKSSFFDKDEMEKDIEFSGKRIKRGLYRSGKVGKINADVNGSLNIMRKVIKESLDDLIEGEQFIHYCRSPLRVSVVTI